MRQREEVPKKEPTAEEKQEAVKAELAKLSAMRSGGTYVPPAKLRALQAQITDIDKTSPEYQRMTWDALKKSLNGLVNKVNTANIKHIVPELFKENLIRGRGLFCKSIMRAQSASLSYTAIYAAMAAVVNSKLPSVIELLVHRLVLQFRKSKRRNDKKVCVSSTTFLAHLVNQQVVHEMLAAQILLVLLNNATDDSVEIAVALTKEVGAHLEEMNSQIALAVFEQFRNILHEGDIEKRSQYMIEVLFQIRKEKYKDHQGVKDDLDLVEEEDQITHNTNLEDPVDAEAGLDVFKFDPEYEANEEAYAKIRGEILGEGSDSEEESGEEDEDESSEEGEEAAEERAMEIKDQTNTDLVNLRRTIYLKIMSSGQFEECVHKLMGMDLPAGRESELPSMIIECASQERTYNKFYGNIGERFCKLNRFWRELFEEQFAIYYDTIHRYETNRLRIVAQFMGHLLANDGIKWDVLRHVKINEEDTTSSSRIFIKILFEELLAALGMKQLAARLKADELQPALTGIFPTDNPKNTRFSINYFTSIQLGVLTEGMREWLANRPPPAPVALPAARSPSRSESVSSYSSYSSYSDSRSPPRKSRGGRGRSESRSVTPPRRGRDRSESYSRSRSRNGRRRSPSDSLSRSRSRRRGRSPSYDSRSPPRKRGARRDSPSVSRSPAPRARGRGRDYSDDSRSPPRGRSYSSSRSRSPPPRSRANDRDRSRSLPPKRGSARSRTPSDLSRPSPPRRSKGVSRRDRSPSYSRSPSRSRSRSPTRRGAAFQPKRARRNTSSPETSRLRSPPSKKAGRSDERRAEARAGPAASKGGEQDAEDLSGIHPSRRGLMGGKPKASDFM